MESGMVPCKELKLKFRFRSIVSWPIELEIVPLSPLWSSNRVIMRKNPSSASNMHSTPNQLLFTSQGSEWELLKFQPPRIYHSSPLVETYRSRNACRSDQEELWFCVGNGVGACVLATKE